MNDLISVIVPAYNVGAWLPRCLDSVLAQTHRVLEVIVVDDGSADATAAVAARYAARDKRVRVFYQAHSGAARARLRGVAEARGAWIGFVDGDDRIAPDMYARLLQNARLYGADIAHCGYRRVMPDGRVQLLHGTGVRFRQDHLRGLRELIEGAVIEPGVWNKLYRAALFDGIAEKADLYVCLHEDLLLNFYLFFGASVSIYEDFCPYDHIERHDGTGAAASPIRCLRDPIAVSLRLLRDAPPQVRDVCLARLARQLACSATASVRDDPTQLRAHRAWARHELRRRLPDLLRADLGARRKALTVFAAVCPHGYAAVHHMYERFIRRCADECPLSDAARFP